MGCICGKSGWAIHNCAMPGCFMSPPPPPPPPPLPKREQKQSTSAPPNSVSNEEAAAGMAAIAVVSMAAMAAVATAAIVIVRATYDVTKYGLDRIRKDKKHNEIYAGIITAGIYATGGGLSYVHMKNLEAYEEHQRYLQKAHPAISIYKDGQSAQTAGAGETEKEADNVAKNACTFKEPGRCEKIIGIPSKVKACIVFNMSTKASREYNYEILQDLKESKLIKQKTECAYTSPLKTTEEINACRMDTTRILCNFQDMNDFIIEHNKKDINLTLALQERLAKADRGKEAPIVTPEDIAKFKKRNENNAWEFLKSQGRLSNKYEMLAPVGSYANIKDSPDGKIIAQLDMSCVVTSSFPTVYENDYVHITGYDSSGDKISGFTDRKYLKLLSDEYGPKFCMARTIPNTPEELKNINIEDEKRRKDKPIPILEQKRLPIPANAKNGTQILTPAFNFYLAKVNASTYDEKNRYTGGIAKGSCMRIFTEYGVIRKNNNGTIKANFDFGGRIFRAYISEKDIVFVDRKVSQGCLATPTR